MYPYSVISITWLNCKGCLCKPFHEDAHQEIISSYYSIHIKQVQQFRYTCRYVARYRDDTVLCVPYPKPDRIWKVNADRFVIRNQVDARYVMLFQLLTSL